MVTTFIAYRVESSPFAEIGGLVVDQNHQRAGIGQQLVSASIVWAKGQGLDQIRVRSNLIRVDAHRFYMRIGFQQLKTAAVFSMPI